MRCVMDSWCLAMEWNVEVLHLLQISQMFVTVLINSSAITNPDEIGHVDP